MRIIGAIAAMTKDRVIGAENTIPWHYSEDFKRFKRTTLNSAIIMGRNTWESIGSKALPKRQNIVISRRPVEGVECYTSIDAAFAAVDDSTNIWVIGGGQIYAETINRCTLLDITTVPDKIKVQGAVRFPEIHSSHWHAGPSQTLAEDTRLSCQRFIPHALSKDSTALEWLNIN